MNKLRTKFLLLGTLSPLTTLASGGDVIEWMGIELIVVIAFVTTLLFLRINWTGKGLMTLIFVLIEYLTMKLTDDVPYSSNNYEK